jgi:predicted N-acetyltransferase YhbS
LDISIVTATRADARALTALRTAVAQGLTLEHGGGPWSAFPSRATVVRQLRASNVLVARHGQEVVGTVRLIRANPLLLDASAFTPADVAIYLIGLAVATQCRGQGVGRQLVEACKGIVRAWSAQALWLDSYEHPAGAGPFYEKCGFRKVGATAFKETPQPHYLGFYEWRAPSR